jgi:hypothetical protein
MPLFNSVDKRKLFFGIKPTGGVCLPFPQVKSMMMVQLEPKYVGECYINNNGVPRNLFPGFNKFS